MAVTRFGRYEIRGELGRGGMATVYHAYDPNFGREVAIKVLPREFLHDPQFRARFEREAKTIALLEHPAIVPVYDFGEEDGQPYIVMRFMSGGSLADRVRRGPVPLAEVGRLISALAPALDVAHAKGIIHRDLKPGNILFDEYGNPFLSDFGIARITQSAGSATLTGSAIIGTPAYMSPEQVQGNKDIDGRSDIYALGVILFQMLAGKMPYESDTPAKVMLMHILDPVPQVSTTKGDIPVVLDRVINQAMAKDPNQRFPTASQMATVLSAAITGQPAVRPVPPPVRSGETVVAPITPSRQPPSGIHHSQVSQPPSGASYPATPPPVQRPVTGSQPSQRMPSGSYAPVRPVRRGLPTWMWIVGGIMLVGLIGVVVIGGGLAIFLNRATPTAVTPSTNSSTGLVTSGLAPVTPANASGVGPVQAWGRGTINQAVISPDGTRVAVASSSGIYLHEAATLQAQTFIETGSWISSVAFSPDSRQVAGGDANGLVRIWDAGSGKLLHSLTGHSGQVRTVLYAPDGNTLFSGGSDKTVRAWNTASGELVRTLEGHTNPVRAMAISPDGSTLVSGGFDQSLRFWSLGSWQLLNTGDAGFPVYTLAYSTDGTVLAVAGSNRAIALVDPKSGQPLHKLEGPNLDLIYTLAFGPEGILLAAGSLEKTYLWNSSNGNLVRTFEGHTGYLRSVGFTPDGMSLLTAGMEGSLRLWRMSDGQQSQVYDGYSSGYNDIALTPDNQRLAVATASNTILIQNAQTGQVEHVLSGHTDWVNSVSISSDGRQLATGGDTTVRIWEISSGNPLQILKGHADLVNRVVYNPKGDLLASGSSDKTIRLWNPADGSLVRTLEGHEGPVTGLAFSPDGKTLASTASDRTMRLWKVADGTVVLQVTLTGPAESVPQQLIFSPDGSRLALPSSSGSLQVFDASSGEVLLTVEGSYAAAFSPDGKLLASANAAGVLLYAADSGQLLTTLAGHHSGSTALVFNKDGSLLYSSGYDGTVRAWGLKK